MSKVVLLVFSSVVAALIVIEFAARILGLTPDMLALQKHMTLSADYGWSLRDDQLGWVNRPGSSLAEQPGHAQMTFLDHGRRVSTPIDKSAATRRVMVVGCSFTQGFGVTDAETYVYRLNDRFPAIAFENFGTGGYGTVQSMMLADREFSDFYRTAKPDLVVYGLIRDHVYRNIPSASRTVALRDSGGRYLVRPHATLAGDTVQFEPFEAVDTWPLERESSVVALAHRAWFYVIHATDWFSRNQLTRRILKEFDAKVRAHGANFLVVALNGGPRFEDAVLKNSGLNYVNCTYPGSGKDPSLRVGGIGHPSAKVHAYWASCISDWIDHHPAQ